MKETGRLAALSVGVRLREARDRRGWTLIELGTKAGVGTTTVTSIETGSRQPRGDTVEKLARALGVPRCWLAYGDGPKPDWDAALSS